MRNIFPDVLSKDKIEYSIWVLVILCVTFVVILWIKQPSSWYRYNSETEYIKCLELVLRSGNITDAETMCSDLKGEK